MNQTSSHAYLSSLESKGPALWKPKEPESNTTIKRKSSEGSNYFSPSKISKSSQILTNPSSARGDLEFEAKGKVTAKRSACESPDTLRSRCYTESPRSYPSGTCSKQPRRLTVEDETEKSFGDCDDFDGLNCSQIEKEAIISTQICDVKKNLKEDLFGSEDDEDDLWDDDGIPDDELAGALTLIESDVREL